MYVELRGKLGQLRSPLTAASVTFALKAGVWFRRGRLDMVAPDSQAVACPLSAETPLIGLCRFPRPALVTNVAAVGRMLT